MAALRAALRYESRETGQTVLQQESDWFRLCTYVQIHGKGGDRVRGLALVCPILWLTVARTQPHSDLPNRAGAVADLLALATHKVGINVALLVRSGLQRGGPALLDQSPQCRCWARMKVLRYHIDYDALRKEIRIFKIPFAQLK